MMPSIANHNMSYLSQFSFFKHIQGLISRRSWGLKVCFYTSCMGAVKTAHARMTLRALILKGWLKPMLALCVV